MKRIGALAISAAFWPWYGRHRIQHFVYRNANVFLFLFGWGLLHFGLADLLMAQTSSTAEDAIKFDTTEIDRATCSLYALLEGPYGALLTAVAGFSALVAAVMGSYQSAYAFLTVGIGCFTARSVNSMYFGAVECDAELGDAIDVFYSSEGGGAGIIDR